MDRAFRGTLNPIAISSALAERVCARVTAFDRARRAAAGEAGDYGGGGQAVGLGRPQPLNSFTLGARGCSRGDSGPYYF